MIKKIFLASVVLILATQTSACVRRIVTIESQPPGAQVYLDHKYLGETPYTEEFLYYGGHHLELTKEGYVNFNTTLQLKAPIYEYFPLSVISELLVPWKITDQHYFKHDLQQGQGDQAVVYPIEAPQPSLPAPRLERIETK
ncbi:MAG: PEGA domain-containing protein [Candidatus Omnitrophica bacterium]|nr:PEGA domain-containing protein [Candidatus Omnitrophota bacterium]